jgi:hypothetical protein
LPQFTDAKPVDINEIYGFPAMEREAEKISFASNPEDLPEELRHLQMDIDP